MNRPLWLSLLSVAVATAGAAYDTIQGRSCLRSMEGMMESMTDLAARHPDLLTITDIGDSYLKNNEGRPHGVYDIPTGGYDIYALKITASDGPRRSRDKGKMLVTSGVHAREWAPPELLGRFVETLVDGYDENADITWILQHNEIHCVLYVNPDGRYIAERYPESYWRKNLNPDGGCGDEEYGVDLNRNFDFMWGDKQGASGHPCDGDYHGERPESEPETRALSDYAKRLFPEGQRKADPEGQMNRPFGEGNTGMYIDIHSSGGFIYYPWGHKDAKSPDDEALQALGRKIHSFNEYKLWAGSQPDFIYEASGDTSDYLYAVMGAATFGLEIGDDFQQDCKTFERDVVPLNLPALVYAAKLARRPFKEVKGPDVLDLEASYANGKITASADASDGRMVNSIRKFPVFRTGDQRIAEVRLYLDVHPDDYKPGDAVWSMQPAQRRLDTEDDQSAKRLRTQRVNCSLIYKRRLCNRAGGGDKCAWNKQDRLCRPAGIAESSPGNGPSSYDGAPIDCGSYTKRGKCVRADGGGKCAWDGRSKTCGPVEDGESPGENDGDTVGENGGSDVAFDSGEEAVGLTIDAEGLSPGRHTLFVQATDSDGYKGPVSSVFVEVPSSRRETSLRSRIP